MYLVLGEERVPLLPVYVGVKFDADAGGRMPTWVLWVHPDWPRDLVFDARGVRPELHAEELPVGAVVELYAVTDGYEVTVRRHPG